MSVLSTTNGTSTYFEDNNDELLHLLTDLWDSPLKESVVHSTRTRDYLAHLTSLSLNELLHEPIQLGEEHSKAKSDAQQLAFRDYNSFLHAQTCRQQVEETLNGLEDHLGEFVSSVPELQEACELFGEHAKTIKEERTKIASVLEHQHVLTDLLEIPQLMETCVWNGYYSEAMDLASHVRLLQVRYPLSIVKSIQEQVQASSDLMLVQLISHLRKPIRLAAAMNVIGFLRRMDVFESEIELRMVFLRCRHDFLQQRVSRVKRDISEDVRQRSLDAFEYLKRFIDVMREQMFEFSTQYISIFSNEQGTILSDYMMHVLKLIKSTLNMYLPMIEDTSSLASLLTQLQYCGMSLGRIGLDFRHAFVHSFEEAVQPLILKWIDTSTSDLVESISKSAEEGLAPSTWMSSKTTYQNSNNSSDSDKVRRNPFQPPMLLVSYPVLAFFTNGILSALNALRLLPAVSLCLPVFRHLEACFLEIGVILKQYSDHATSNIPDDVTHIQAFASAFVRCCVPYLKSCLLDGIYGDLVVPNNVDESLETLLGPYLPVVRKETQEEESENVVDIDNQIEDRSDDIPNTVTENQVQDTSSTQTNDPIEDVMPDSSLITADSLEVDKKETEETIESNKDLPTEEEQQKETTFDVERKDTPSTNEHNDKEETIIDETQEVSKSQTEEQTNTESDTLVETSTLTEKDALIEKDTFIEHNEITQNNTLTRDSTTPPEDNELTRNKNDTHTEDNILTKDNILTEGTITEKLKETKDKDNNSTQTTQEVSSHKADNTIEPAGSNNINNETETIEKKPSQSQKKSKKKNKKGKR